MNLAPRDMPTLTATYKDGSWRIVLPDGRAFRALKAWAIEDFVRRECPGTSLRWTAGEAP